MSRPHLSPAHQIVLWIRHRRRARGWTLRELAERLEVTTATLSNVETGRHVPRPELAEQLGRELGRSAAESKRTARALRAWAELARVGGGPGEESARTERERLVDDFISEQRRKAPESVLESVPTGARRRGRPTKAPVNRLRQAAEPAAERRWVHERDILRLPVFREEDDPGDPRLREPEPLTHRFLDRRAFGDALELEWAYMVRVSRATAQRLGAPFAAGDIAVLTREGVPGPEEEVFHVPARAGGYMLAKVLLLEEGRLVIFAPDEPGGPRFVDWPSDLSKAAKLVPGRVIGVLHRMGR